MRRIHVIALLIAALLVFALPRTTSAQISVGLSVHVGPPPLPVYTQPLCPGPGYLWTPGYWAYGPDGYYWVPGTWVVAPVGMLWTPGYWGWGGSAFIWHAGYWGPHVGFYGGINYGFGYGGVGFVGGRWDHGVFAYNTAVTRVNVNVIHNTYVDRTVVVNNVNHVSFNGGRGGIDARPTREEMSFENERHIPATSAQVQHEHMAGTNRSFLASENHGHPAMAATSRPGQFSSRGSNNSFRPPAHNDNTGRSAGMNSRPPANENRGEAHPNNAPRNAPHGEEHSNEKPRDEHQK